MPDLTGYNLMNGEEKLQYELLAGRYTAKDNMESQDALDALYYSRLKEMRRYLLVVRTFASGLQSLSQPICRRRGQSHAVWYRTKL